VRDLHQLALRRSELYLADLGLILLPFGLIVVIVGILGYLNWKAHLGRRGLSPATARGAHRYGFGPRTIVRRLVGDFGAKDDPQIIKETT